MNAFWTSPLKLISGNWKEVYKIKLKIKKKNVGGIKDKVDLRREIT